MRALSFEAAQVVNHVFLAGLIATGLLHENPQLFYDQFLKATVVLFFGSLVTAGLFQVFARSVGVLIQTSPSAQPEHLAKELRDTFTGFALTVASIAAWPLTQAAMGRETAIQDDIRNCSPGGSHILYIVKVFVGLLATDAYNYWKHRFFHHRLLWPFHKVHHAHHNPSAIGGYAISVAYGFATFWPIYLFCFPEVGLYLPLHFPFLGFYFFLNHYLHSGYTIKAIEKVLSPFYVMTSAWHNVHHEKGRVGYNYKDQTFGELLTIWDLYMGTYPQGHYLHSGGHSDKTLKSASKVQ